MYYISKIVSEYRRRKILKTQLKDLSDPGLLDRAMLGEQAARRQASRLRMHDIRPLVRE